MIRRLAFVLLAASSVLAADRHVYLNESGGGSQLDDCPNPAHNAKGTSNTDELEYCAGGSSSGKIIGTVTGTVTSGTCTTGGGSVTAVTNGVSADVDRDGTNETVYGHPQACVWNMAKSDSCEIHAGDYHVAGAQCDKACGYDSGSTSTTACERQDCWLAMIFASGYGPNLAAGGYQGYGTSVAPGYLRGAVMNGSADTWDTNGNKVPDADEAVTGYPAKINHDLDQDVAFDPTDCSGASCTGDAYFSTIVGCGNASGSYGRVHCPVSPPGGVTWPMIDSDANGTFDTAVGTAGPKDTSWLTIKDLEYLRGNGGLAASAFDEGGVRTMAGRINWGGDGSSDGPRIDHIYMHDDDFSYSEGCITAPGQPYNCNGADPDRETYWSEIQDEENGRCSDYMEVKNSYFVVGNRMLINDDCGGTHGKCSSSDVDCNDDGDCAEPQTCSYGYGDPCGCPKNVHDNRIVLDPKRSPDPQVPQLAYLKSIDSIGAVGSTRPKQHRFWNNEIIFKGTDNQAWLWDVQALGRSMHENPDYGDKCSGGTGCGELWFYGNIVRIKGTGDIKRIHAGFCGGGVESRDYGEYVFKVFNNTFDLEDSGAAANDVDYICSGSSGVQQGKRVVEKNNAWYKSGAVHLTPSGSVQTSRVNEVCSVSSQPSCTTDSNGRAAWWTVGTRDVAIHSGLATYIPKNTGPLYEKTANDPCDPDGNGSPGYDVDWDGDDDTSWYDIAGNLVSCPTVGTALSIGAIQPNSDAVEVHGVRGASLRGAKVTGTGGASLDWAYWPGDYSATGIIGANTAPATWRPFAASSPWNTPIGANPAIHADSTTIAKTIASQAPKVRLASYYTAPVWFVNSANTTNRYVQAWGCTSGYADCSGGGSPVDRSYFDLWDADYPTTPRMSDVTNPWAQSMWSEATSDGHVAIVDPFTLTYWELSRAWWIDSTHPASSTFNVWDLTGPGYGLNPATYSPTLDRWQMQGARGSGVPWIAGLLTPDECAAGLIRHALAAHFSCNRDSDALTSIFQYPPATRSDGNYKDNTTSCNGTVYAKYPIEGMRLYLDPPAPLTWTGLGLSAAGLAVAQALHDYGVFIVENGGSSPNAFGIYASLLADDLTDPSVPGCPGTPTVNGCESMAEWGNRCPGLFTDLTAGSSKLPFATCTGTYTSCATDAACAPNTCDPWFKVVDTGAPTDK